MPRDPRMLDGPPGTRFESILWLEEIDSTNRYLMERARDGAREGLVAVADHQSAGRGRLGRSWEAPPGANLLASMLLVPNLAPTELHLVTAVVALAGVRACAELAGITPSIKWPNDLVVGDRKLAGLLAESVMRPGGRAVVVGIGLNVDWCPPDRAHETSLDPVPHQEMQPPGNLLATSLAQEGATSVDRLELLRCLLEDLDDRLQRLASLAGRISEAREYRSRCSTLGRRVRVIKSPGDPFSTIEGVAVDISTEGHLLVETPYCLETITAADVVHLRY